MSNALACNYSFHGAHKKKAFQKLKLYDVISSKSNHIKISITNLRCRLMGTGKRNQKGGMIGLNQLELCKFIIF